MKKRTRDSGDKAVENGGMDVDDSSDEEVSITFLLKASGYEFCVSHTDRHKGF